MNPFIGILLDAAAKAGAKFARLKAARKLIDSVKKKTPVVGLAMVLALGTYGCAVINNLDDCSKLRLAEQLACPVDPESKECKEARELLAAKCGWVPPPVVPPVTPPVDPPVTPPVDPPVDPPITPPPATGCTLAGEPTVFVSTPNTLGEVVNLAMHNLRPDCEVGGLCLLGDMRQQEWQAAVEAELRRLGFCAGQHSPGTDEIAVAAKPDDLWQGFHVFAGDDSSRATFVRRTVKWSPQAYTGAWRSPNLNPPVEPPVVSTCPVAPCPAREWTVDTLPAGWDPALVGQPSYLMQWKYHTMGNNDTTPNIVRQCSYCNTVMNDPNRCGCPVRPDGHPDRVAVENWLLYGGFERDSRGGQDCSPLNTSNPAAWLAGSGNCRMCNATKTVCTDWN